MQFSAVALMLAETIFRKTRAKVTHHRVARDFRDHTGGGDGEAEAVAIDDSGLWKRKGNDGQAIDQYVIGRDREGGNRCAHRLVRRPQNIDPVNLDGIEIPAQRSSALAISRYKFLRISGELFESFKRRCFQEDHRGGDN